MVDNSAMHIYARALRIHHFRNMQVYIERTNELRYVTVPASDLRPWPQSRRGGVVDALWQVVHNFEISCKIHDTSQLQELGGVQSKV